jgi:4-amino-4-deoxy-L-arabinose transferase-like glycosyltransferase
VPLIALGAILALSAFLQFYRLNDLQHFQGDEGLSVLAVRALIMDHRFPVYGLALAVGSAHIGPLFDYLIAIPLWLFHYNPTAAVALNGICQVLAVGLCYDLMTRHGGGRVAGLVAALVLATSQEVVYYSRFLWPNMLPCLVVLILWSLLELRDGRQHHLALLGIWTGVALQLQPTAVLLVPFYVLYLLVFRPPLWSWRYALLGLAAMLLLFAPVIVHELTHGLVETRAWLAYGHHSNGGPGRALGPTLARVVVLAWRLLGIHQGAWAIALGLALGAGVCARAVLGQGVAESSTRPGGSGAGPAASPVLRGLPAWLSVFRLGAAAPLYDAPLPSPCVGPGAAGRPLATARSGTRDLTLASGPGAATTHGAALVGGRRGAGVGGGQRATHLASRVSAGQLPDHPRA